MRNAVFFVALSLYVMTIAACGGSNPSPAPTATPEPLPTPKSAPATIEEAPEPTLGTFGFTGTRAGVSLLVSDNTVERGVVTGAIDRYAPNGWKFDQYPWDIPQSVISLNERLDGNSISTYPYPPPLRLRFPKGTTLAPGNTLSRGVYWLAPDGYNSLVNRPTGFVWEMRGGQIIVEENGAVAEQPAVQRLRLRLRGVRMEPPSTTGDDESNEIFPSWYFVSSGEPTAYFPGSGTFTFNGVIVLERDTTFSTIYNYPGATSPAP